MANNVYEYLLNTNKPLIDKIATNQDIGEFLMSVYKHVEAWANDHENDPKDLILRPTIVRERLLVIYMEYYEKNTNTTHSRSRHPSQRNSNILELFKVNFNIRDIAKNVVLVLERWLDEKPERKQQGFENIKLFPGSARLLKDGTFIVELVLKIDFYDYVNSRLKFEGLDAPEQPTEDEPNTKEAELKEEKKQEEESNQVEAEPVPELEWKK